MYIYILKLQDGKYYVGKTMNPDFRLSNHVNGNGSTWTKIHKPVKLLELIPNCDDYDEDKYTRMYMDKYGIDNVRGGSFTSIELDKATRDSLMKMSIATNNKCFTCGKAGHFAKDCAVLSSQQTYIVSSRQKCFVCGKYDHKSSECIYDMWCCSKCDREFDTKTACLKHEQYCNKGANMVNKCFRCGREGHYVTTCYATQHVKGYYLD